MARLPLAMANLMLCCLLVVGPAALAVGSTYSRPHSLTCIARIDVMMSHEALLLSRSAFTCAAQVGSFGLVLGLAVELLHRVDRADDRSARRLARYSVLVAHSSPKRPCASEAIAGSFLVRFSRSLRALSHHFGLFHRGYRAGAPAGRRVPQTRAMSADKTPQINSHVFGLSECSDSLFCVLHVHHSQNAAYL